MLAILGCDEFQQKVQPLFPYPKCQNKAYRKRCRKEPSDYAAPTSFGR